jgi:transcriptional regulator with XRE-family HTH domain
MIVALKGAEIKKVLARKSISQNCFAYKLGISSSYMSQLMTGIRNPSPALRKKILKYLKLDESNFDDLFLIKDTGKKS